MKTFALLLLFPFASLADSCIKSPVGNSLCFAKPMVGENFDAGSWGELYLLRSGKKIPLPMAGRYFGMPDESNISPSGNYINIVSVEWGYLDEGKGSKEFVDRAYCSVIDLRTGCIVSDWDGAMCGYGWEKDNDTLSSSDGVEKNTFDFLSFKPGAQKFKTGDRQAIRNLLRCEAVSRTNLGAYIKIAGQNPENSDISAGIARFYTLMGAEQTVSTKTWLYSDANDGAISKAYLIDGDRVKTIRESDDRMWRQILYITAKKRAVVGWVKTGTLK